MAQVKDILRLLQDWSPSAIAWEKDNVGLLIGDPDSEVSRLLVTLDVTPEVLDEAHSLSASTVISHHPPIYHPLRRVREDEGTGSLVAKAVRRHLNIIALHTNADMAAAGLNRYLARKLGLMDITPLDESGLHRVLLRSILRAGDDAAERLAETRISFPGLVEYPLAGADGTRRVEVNVPSWKAEETRGTFNRIWDRDLLAWETIRLEEPPGDAGLGAIGNLSREEECEALLESVKRILGAGAIRTNARGGECIRRMAVCGGAGAPLIPKAIARGAEMYVTADLTYHHFSDFMDRIVLVDAGHYETEHVFIDACVEQLTRRMHEEGELIELIPSSLDTNPIRYR